MLCLAVTTEQPEHSPDSIWKNLPNPECHCLAFHSCRRTNWLIHWQSAWTSLYRSVVQGLKKPQVSPFPSPSSTPAASGGRTTGDRVNAKCMNSIHYSLGIGKINLPVLRSVQEPKVIVGLTFISHNILLGYHVSHLYLVTVSSLTKTRCFQLCVLEPEQSTGQTAWYAWGMKIHVYIRFKFKKICFLKSKFPYFSICSSAQGKLNAAVPTLDYFMLLV